MEDRVRIVAHYYRSATVTCSMFDKACGGGGRCHRLGPAGRLTVDNPENVDNVFSVKLMSTELQYADY